MKGLNEPCTRDEAKAIWLGWLLGLVTGLIIGMIIWN